LAVTCLAETYKKGVTSTLKATNLIAEGNKARLAFSGRILNTEASGLVISDGITTHVAMTLPASKATKPTEKGFTAMLLGQVARSGTLMTSLVANDPRQSQMSEIDQ